MFEVDGEPLARRARRPGPAARAAPLLLEERQVGLRTPAARPRRARASGSATATTTAATRGSSSATRATDDGPSRRARTTGRSRRSAGSTATVVDDHRRDAEREDLPARAREPDSAPRRPALRGPPHRAGRLPASRSYSVASAPDDSGEIELTVERLEDGEVSSFLHDVVVVGDELEVRGPIGRWFVWEGDTPALLRRRRLGRRPADGDAPARPRDKGTSDLVRLVVSVRTPHDLYYAAELARSGDDASSTRASRRRRSPRPAGHLTADDLAPAILPDATAYVCGSAGFCDAATNLLTDLDFPVDRIRVERFGATG